MAHDFLIYDFGSDEDAAHQARHKVESWAQGFRLGKKILVKFDWVDDGEAKEPSKHEKDGHDKKKAATPGRKVHGIVRLDFSSHEKLSHKRWLERIPGEEPFKSAKGKVIRAGDAKHHETSERFEALE